MKEEGKRTRLKKAAGKKEEMKERLLQKKLTERWLILPEKERLKFRCEEEKRRRMKIKKAKEKSTRKISGEMK